MLHLRPGLLLATLSPELIKGVIEIPIVLANHLQIEGMEVDGTPQFPILDSGCPFTMFVLKEWYENQYHPKTCSNLITSCYVRPPNAPRRRRKTRKERFPTEGDMTVFDYYGKMIVNGVDLGYTTFSLMCDKERPTEPHSLFGLAMRAGEAHPPSTVEQLYKNGVIDDMSFTLHVDTVTDGNRAPTRGLLKIGDLNPQISDNKVITFVPVLRHSHWRVHLNYVDINGFNIPANGDIAEFDTGANYMNVPAARWDDMILQIQKAFGLKLDTLQPENVFTVPCSSIRSLPDFGFGLRGFSGKTVPFNITPAAYTTSIKRGCYLRFIQWSQTHWLLPNYALVGNYLHFRPHGIPTHTGPVIGVAVPDKPMVHPTSPARPPVELSIQLLNQLHVTGLTIDGLPQHPVLDTSCPHMVLLSKEWYEEKYFPNKCADAPTLCYEPPRGVRLNFHEARTLPLTIGATMEVLRHNGIASFNTQDLGTFTFDLITGHKGVQPPYSLFGLGISKNSKYPSMLEQLDGKRAIKNDVSFSLYLGPANEKDEVRGSLRFGPPDSQLYVGPMLFVPVTGRNHWTVTADYITVGDMALNHRIEAEIDTGTNHLSVPDRDWADFRVLLENALPTHAIFHDGTARVLCSMTDSLPVITFGIRGFGPDTHVPLPLYPEAYTVRRKISKEPCFVTIESWKGDQWLLPGYALLGNYLHFRPNGTAKYKRPVVGIAKLKKAPTSTSRWIE